MSKWTSLAFGLVFAAALVVVVLAARAPAKVPSGPASSAPAQELPAPEPPTSAAVATKLEKPPADTGVDAGADLEFTRLPDGGQVPELPKSAPQGVSVGIVLFHYKGAQMAPRDARSKAEALSKARETLALAQTDFDEAVKQGDSGSTSNAGSIPRGVLEPAVQYAVFTLEKGAVYKEPISTPRGYWIVKRLK